MSTQTAVGQTLNCFTAADPAPQVGQRVEIIPGGFSGDQGVIKRESYGRYMVETDSGMITGYYRPEQLKAVK
jgi:hypothetical protein